MKKDRLLEAARRVLNAYRKYGPVDDGRPEGDEFEAALDELSDVCIEKEVIARLRNEKPKTT